MTNKSSKLQIFNILRVGYYQLIFFVGKLLNHYQEFKLLRFLNSFVSNPTFFSTVSYYIDRFLRKPTLECKYSSKLFCIFRKLQWIRFSVKTPFNFLETTSISELGVNFKDACKRLWKVLVSDSNPTFGSLNPVKCDFCRQYTCTPTCIEERRGYKVAIDIGGKSTKIIREDFR